MFLLEALLCLYPGYLQMQLFIMQKYSVGCFCFISVGSYCSLGCLFNSHTGWSYVAGLIYAFSGCIRREFGG